MPHKPPGHYEKKTVKQGSLGFVLQELCAGYENENKKTHDLLRVYQIRNTFIFILALERD